MKHYAPGSFNMIDKDGKEYFLTVEQDDYAENPRDMYDNISTIYCWHKHYIIGDDKPKEKTARDVLADMCEKYTNMEADDIDAASENDMIRELQQAKDIDCLQCPYMEAYYGLISKLGILDSLEEKTCE